MVHGFSLSHALQDQGMSSSMFAQLGRSSIVERPEINKGHVRLQRDLWEEHSKRLRKRTQDVHALKVKIALGFLVAPIFLSSVVSKCLSAAAKR